MPEVAGVAIAYRSDQFSIPVMYGDLLAVSNRLIHMQAKARKRNIFQIRDPALLKVVFVPYYFNQFGAEKPDIDSSFLHISLIGRVG